MTESPPCRVTGNRRVRRMWIGLASPLLFLCAATIFFRLTEVDLLVSRLFFSGDWRLRNVEPFNSIYLYGPIPGCLLAVAGLVGWYSLRNRNAEAARGWLYCMLLVVIGPGLLVNGFLKPLCQRPRPSQIEEFGGAQKFVPVAMVGQEGITSVCKSFPSGHASMGFVLIGPALILRRRYPRLASLSLIVGLVAGVVLGGTRVIQGKHYLSDVFWSAGLIHLTAVSLYYAMGFHRCRELAEETEDRRRDEQGNVISIPMQHNKELNASRLAESGASGLSADPKHAEHHYDSLEPRRTATKVAA